MKISNIFAHHAIKIPHLYAVQYEDEKLNEWRRLFEVWNDQQYLRNFFEAKSSDTKTIRYYSNNKWIKYTIEEAMDITLETAYYMEKDIIKYAEGNGYTLASKFKPLDERYMKGANEMKSKKFWLRIYAIHEISDDTDLYIVSGGGIKLVHQMQDCIFLQKELDKLKITQTYLHSL